MFPNSVSVHDSELHVALCGQACGHSAPAKAASFDFAPGAKTCEVLYAFL